MTGELSMGHETLKGSCLDCHTPYRNRFTTCISCHNDVTEFSIHKTGGSLPCIRCHNSHFSGIRVVKPETCLSRECHQKFGLEKEHSLDTGLCLKCHPEHLSRQVKVKTSSLKFSHKVHTSPSRQTSFSSCIYCHPFTFNGVVMGKPKGLKKCGKCHEKVIKGHLRQKPLSEHSCSWCHYPEKRELTELSTNQRLSYAEFSHDAHFSIKCTLCHSRMKEFETLEEIRVFPGKKYAFCAKCHPHTPLTFLRGIHLRR